jgi:hypothetical protein
MELDIDNWKGNLNKGENIPLPKDGVDIIVEKLNNLNQRTHTQLILATETSYLLVGGGNGQYVCTFSTREDERYFNLINQLYDNTDEEIAIVTGGQEGLFSNRLVLKYDEILPALTYYFYNEKMNPKLVWEED